MAEISNHQFPWVEAHLNLVYVLLYVCVCLWRYIGQSKRQYITCLCRCGKWPLWEELAACRVCNADSALQCCTEKKTVQENKHSTRLFGQACRDCWCNAIPEKMMKNATRDLSLLNFRYIFVLLCRREGARTSLRMCNENLNCATEELWLDFCLYPSWTIWNKAINEI